MDFESAMQTFAEAWVAANASLKGQLQQQPQQQQQQQPNESRESSEGGSSQPLRPLSRLMETDQVRLNDDVFKYVIYSILFIFDTKIYV